MKKVLLAVAVFVLVAPPVAWAAYKPMRVLAPALNGVDCIDNQICVEEGATISDANELYEKALHYVNSSVGEIRKKPRAIFCVTERCYESFGFRAPAKATNIGVSGIVVSPRGWNEYYLRHEMIHHLQAERLGVIGQLLSPSWFSEGMAYALSKQPRNEISEPWRAYSYQFDEWYQQIGAGRLWEEAAQL